MAAALIVAKKRQGTLVIDEYHATLPTEGVKKAGVLGRQATSVSGISFPSRKVPSACGVPFHSVAGIACELPPWHTSGV